MKHQTADGCEARYEEIMVKGGTRRNAKEKSGQNESDPNGSYERYKHGTRGRKEKYYAR